MRATAVLPEPVGAIASRSRSWLGLHLRCISPVSPLHLRYISAISPLHLSSHLVHDDGEAALLEAIDRVAEHLQIQGRYMGDARGI